jgi:hypothetical protein
VRRWFTPRAFTPRAEAARRSRCRNFRLATGWVFAFLSFVGVGAGSYPSAEASESAANLTAPPQAVESQLTRGPAVTVGLGYQYTAIGAQIIYYFPFGHLNVAPYLGGGWTAENSSAPVNGAAGVSVLYGVHHRLLVDGCVGYLRTDYLNLHGTVVDHHRVYGFSTGIGYEHWASNGSIIRIVPGFSFPLNARLGGEDERPAFTFTLGVGSKLW